MIAFDTNILVYAHRKDSPFHDAAKECVRYHAEGHEAWSIPWPCIHEFLSIVTHARIFRTPTPVALAMAQVEAWARSPRLVLLTEDDGYGEVLSRLVKGSKVHGPKIHDARIGALAIFHDVVELLTADRDFSRFGELKVRNPL